jgi:hypothetical protein
MRKWLIAVAVAGLLGSAMPVASAAAEGAPAWLEAESAAIATLRRLLRRRGFGAEVTAGPMLALPPGQATVLEFGGDGDGGALLDTGLQPDAWLVETNAGRWWLWETGAAAPADRAAELARDLAPRRVPNFS